MTPRVLVVFTAFAMGGCSSLLDVERPSNVATPGTIDTQLGAFALRDGTIGLFNSMFSPHTRDSGRLADEFQTGQSASLTVNSTDPDTRRLPTDASTGLSFLYGTIQAVRANAELAIQALKKSAPTAPTSFIGHMQSLAGYTRVLLAEDFCNGVVTSFVPLDGELVNGSQKTNAELYADAVAFFDSALVAGADSSRIVNLAAVGKGRALLNLGQFAAAATAVAAVPTSFVFNAEYSTARTATQNWYSLVTPSNTPALMSDKEGINGLNFRSAADPRLAVTQVSTTPSTTGRLIFLPTKFLAGNAPIPIATGIEARLIEAEAALHAGNVSGWLTMLNALRTTCTSAVGCPTPAPAGSGGVAGLPPLADPGASTSRIDLMFRERAFWLFGTGHRLGDLRRLLRQYGRDQATVYPIGFYGFNDLVYGSDVQSALPTTAYNNPNVPPGKSCLDRNP